MEEKDLLEKGYRKYCGDKVDIYFNVDMCEHSGNCTKGSSLVFNVDRKPWIIVDAEPSENVVRTIDTCPSGALKYIVK